MTESKVGAARQLLASGLSTRETTSTLGASPSTLYRLIPAEERAPPLYPYLGALRIREVRKGLQEGRRSFGNAGVSVRCESFNGLVRDECQINSCDVSRRRVSADTALRLAR